MGVIPGWLTVASAGGGGSSSDGGGELLFLIGYLPMHFLGARFRKKDNTKAGTVIVWPVAVIYSILLITIFRGYGFFMAIGAFAGAGAGLYGWWGKLKRNKAAEAHLAQAAQLDSAWDPTTLNTYAAQVLQRFQYDWSMGDTESMKGYLSPRYHYHCSLMMYALGLAARQNRMSDVQISEQHIQSVSDSTDNSQDSFTVGFEVSAQDEIVDTRTQQVLFANKHPFVEYWTFLRSGNGWLLDGIQPATATLSVQNQTVKTFAESQAFCYSLDWGWLLLPQRGQLFGKGKFGTSDINNHVIGVHNNLVLQIYTYSPAPAQNARDMYLVAQASLPKSYGDIVVKRRKGLNLFNGIKGLQQVSTEWPDFNKKYDVFASSTEGATSLELLNPKFMETLEAQPFEVNLEVVDNVVYFYTKQTSLKPEYYPAFLAILQEAFKQMRL